MKSQILTFGFLAVAVELKNIYNKLCKNYKYLKRMEEFTSERRAKPTVDCQYGKNCKRRNPDHFRAYKHEHLDKIIEQNTNKQLELYVIPDELTHKELIREQIIMINELFSKEEEDEPSAKKTKSDERNTTMTKISTSVANSFDQSNIHRATKANSASTNATTATAPTSASTPQNDFAPKVDIHKHIKVEPAEGNMAEKLSARAYPSNFFLTRVSSSPPTHNGPQSISERRAKPTDICPRGEKCDRKNPHHFMAYKHEHLDRIMERNKSNQPGLYVIPDEMAAQKDTILQQIKVINELFPTVKVEMPRAIKIESGEQIITMPMPMTSKYVKHIKVESPKGNMAEKLAASRPFNFVLTRISSSPQTHNEPLSITFQDIFDKSLGELECSVQINYMVEPDWLLGQYELAGCLHLPMLIIYGTATPPGLDIISQENPQITAHLVRMKPMATHHTKMMLLGYKDGSMRVVVSTANLYEDDWKNHAQGLWISDKLKALPEGSHTTAGESPTEFRNELLKYLSAYKLPQLQPWLDRVRKTDFSGINVFLITSIPGTYQETSNGYPHGHGRVAWLLLKHSAPISNSSEIVAQSSALGYFGGKSDGWLTKEFVNSLRRDSLPVGLGKIPILRVIYPSFNNVANSHDGLLGGGCLAYDKKKHEKQTWLNDYLYQWRADCRYRTRAMPHIKTYMRYSDKKMYWFMLTSANLSKSAWGSLSKSKTSPTLGISNYEAGVLFFPKFVVPKTRYFSMDESDQSTPLFPPVYDIPLTKYAIDDTPFLSDILLPDPCNLQ